MRMMLPQRNVLTVLRGPCGWLAVAILTVAAVLIYANLASAQQTSTEATLTAPALTAEADNGRVGLNWTEVTGAERYGLWVWTSADGWQQIGGDNLTGTTYSHTGLTAGTTYYYTVRAVHAGSVTGPWSEYASATYEEQPLAAPTLTAEAGEGAIEMSWTRVTGAERYELWGWTSADGWQQIGGDNLTGTSYTHTDVTAEVTYFYTIRAVNTDGETGPWSEYVNVTLQQVQPPQDTPTPTITETPTITPTFAITATPTNTAFPPPAATATPTTTPTATLTPTTTLTDHQPGENIPATGAPTLSGNPRVCEKLTADLSNISDEDGLEDVEFQLQWFAKHPETELGRGGWWRGVVFYDPNEDGLERRQFTIGSWNEGLPMYVMVFFDDDKGNSEWVHSALTGVVAAASNPKKPNAPRQVEVEPGGSGELTVSWHGPSPQQCDDGGSIVTEFKVQWKLVTDDWGTPDDVSEATIDFESVLASYTIGGLTDGVEYAVRIRATNAIGDGAASSEVTATPQDSETQ